MEDTIYKKEEFHKFPFDKEFDESRMSFGKGGHGFKDGTWVLQILTNDKNCDADIYELPEYFQFILNTVYQWGMDAKRREIKGAFITGLRAMGIDSDSI
jgi:hypothetical protein